MMQYFHLPSDLLYRLIQARDDEGLPISVYISSFAPFLHIPAFPFPLPHYTIRADSSQQVFQAPQEGPQTENVSYAYLSESLT